MLAGSGLGLLVAAVGALEGFLLPFSVESFEDHASVGLCLAHCSNLNYDYIYRQSPCNRGGQKAWQ